MQLHIVRHGQTEFNVGKPRFRGQLDISLSTVGIQQAETIAIALKAIPLDVIYYSRLQRFPLSLGFLCLVIAIGFYRKRHRES